MKRLSVIVRFLAILSITLSLIPARPVSGKISESNQLIQYTDNAYGYTISVPNYSVNELANAQFQLYYPNGADSTFVITYENVQLNPDGSYSAIVTLTNKKAIVYDVVFEHTGDVSGPYNVLNWPLMPLLPKRQWSVPLTFNPGSSVTFKLAKVGHSSDGKDVTLWLDVVSAIWIVLWGDYLPTKPAEILPGFISNFVDLVGQSGVDLSEAIIKADNGDWRGALESTFNAVKNSPQTVHSFLVLMVNNPPTLESIDNLLQIGHRILGFLKIAPFVWDFTLAPVAVQATISNNAPAPPPPPPLPPPPQNPAFDLATIIAHVTLPNGSTVSPDQTLTKTWRIRNSGSSTWGRGYQLAFVGGNQLGAPNSINLPYNVAPNQIIDISVNVTAPSVDGIYQGNWRMRNPNGTYFGDNLWVNIQVGTSNDNITLTVDPPSPASADQVRIYARVQNFPDLRALRILIDGEQLCELGAPEIQDCVWHTSEYSSGQHSITVEADDWTGPSWDNPERKSIVYELAGGGTVNHTPYRPDLVANPAYDWYVTIGNAPQLCAQEQGDPDGDAITQYRFVASASVGTVDSGWVNSSCHDFGSINAGTYEWHAQVKDSKDGISEWSDNWHFTVEPTGIDANIDHFSPGSPSNAEEVRIYGCTSGHAGVNITMRVLVNDANDGTDSGEWHIIKEQGSPCFNDVDVPIWRTLEYSDGPHLVRLVAWAIQPDAGDVFDTVYTLNHRRPASPHQVAPVPPSGVPTEAVFLNSRTVTLKWAPAIRAQTYTLHIGTNPSPASDPSPVLRQTFDSSITEHTITFDQAYSTLYWQVEATNDVSSNFSGAQIFGIDLENPSCAVSNSTSTTYERVFQVNWNGTDNLSDLRSFDIQFMDSERGTWEDWLASIPSDRVYELFTGQPGHTYFFRCRALDNAGNTMDYPALADTSITVDPEARPPTPWWDSAYAAKRNITILNNMPSLEMPSGYPVHLHFDSNSTPAAAELYNASQSSPKCDDLRIVHNDTTELDRIVQNCSTSAIDIWFRSQVSIAGGTSDNTSHQLYYDNPSAGAPLADPNQVWYPYREADTTYLYFMQEGNGSTAYDSSGNGRNCSINSSVQWSSSKYGRGLRFNRANYGDSRSLNCGSAIPLTAFTIEFWYKPDSDDGGNIAGELAGGGNGGGGNNWQLQNFGGRIRFDTWECSTCGSQEVRSNFNLRDAAYVGKWNHIAVTFNGGNEVKFYINGRLDSTKYLQDSGINRFTPPLEIGSVEGIGQIKANLGTFRISNSVKTNFSYGSFAAITNEPTTAAGQVITPTPSGAPDLVIISMTTYPNPEGGVIVEAVVQNQGDLSTKNGFYTDLYLDHQPDGAGDYTGSLRFWINDPIAPEEIVTLTTVITDLSSLGGTSQQSATSSVVQTGQSVQSMGTFIESSGTLYAQTDSAGLVREPDDQNNIYATGTPICTAGPDSFESDDTFTTANSIAVGDSQAHNLHLMEDQDWIKFDAEAGKIYRLNTTNLDTAADTFLYLYDTDGTTLVASNDDFDGTLASQIDWQSQITGTYYVVVKHWNPNVAGCGTGYTLSLVDITPPNAPTNIVATAQSHKQIDLTWSDNANDENGFEIERSLDELVWTQLATIGADSTSFSDNELTPSTTYFYRVRAYNANGYSDYANIASDMTYEPPTLVDQKASNEVMVEGTPTGRLVETYENDGFVESITEVESGGKPSNRYSYLEHKWIFEVQPGTTVTFNTNVWAGTSIDGDEFTFEYSTDDQNYTEMFLVSAASDDDIYQSFPLPSSISGNVYIRIMDTDRTPGNRSLDTVYVDHLFIQTVIVHGPTPSSPSDLIASAISSNQIELSWADNASNEKGFEVERSLDNENWEKISTVPTDTTNFTDDNLLASTTYSYRIRAFNTSSLSEYSNTASATTSQASTVHVGDIDSSANLADRNRWEASVTIAIHDANELPVVDATVSGAWSGGISGTGTCVTDGNGLCSITKSNIKGNISSVNFSVTDIVQNGTVYQPSDNHDPDGDSDGTSITINQP